MVGFGSSLRRARRPGWEGAYLDYESLKLLLSQIEAVYEEEAHRQHHQIHSGGGVDWDLFDENNNNNATGAGGDEGGGGTGTVMRDYRDELFLESDSDAAFQTLMELDTLSAEEQRQHESDIERRDNGAAAATSTTKNQQHQALERIDSMAKNHHQHHHNQYGAFSQQQDPIVSYAAAAVNNDVDSDDSQDDDDDEYDDSKLSKCVPGTGFLMKGRQQSKDKNKKAVAKSKFGRKASTGAGGAGFPLKYPKPESEFFISTGHHHHPRRGQSDTNAFILKEESSQGNDDYDNDAEPIGGDAAGKIVDNNPSLAESTTSNTTSLLQVPFRRTGSGGELTPLLPAATTDPTEQSSVIGPSSFYSFKDGPVTPPQRPPMTVSLTQHHTDALSFPGFTPTTNTNPTPIFSSTTSISTSSMLPPGMTRAQVLAIEEQRRQERRERRRRRRQMARKKKELEQKVPRHIRIAHAKARDITERFLGLIKAETEKVMLFAESRLGELADTVGSLRFPTIDDDQHPYSHHQPHHHHHHHRHHNHHRTTPSRMSFEYHLSEGGLHPSASSSSVSQSTKSFKK